MEDKRVRLLSEMQAALIFFNQPLAAIDAQDLILCPATAGVAEALALMEECGVNMIVVQDAEGRLAGVLTDRDIKKCAKLGRDPVTCPVTTIMSAPILSLPGQSPVFEAWQFMMRHNITHLFVADQDGRISGWISSNDIASIQKYSPAVLLLEIQHSPPPRASGCPTPRAWIFSGPPASPAATSWPPTSVPGSGSSDITTSSSPNHDGVTGYF